MPPLSVPADMMWMTAMLPNNPADGLLDLRIDEEYWDPFLTDVYGCILNFHMDISWLSTRTLDGCPHGNPLDVRISFSDKFYSAADVC